MVGRDEELAALTGAIRQVSERGSATIVTGEAGIGKSTLLRAALDYGRASGLQILSTAGVETEAGFPFAGLHQLLRPVLEHAEALPAGQRRALRSAFNFENGPSSEPLPTALAVLNLLAAVAARRPVLIVADDAHWLDRPSQEALAFVARRVSGDPIVVIGAARKDVPGPIAAAGLRELELLGLDDAAARRVVAASAAGLSHANRERILRESLGNPLALVELPAAWSAAQDSSLELLPQALPLTPRLEQAFTGRVAELPAVTQDALLVAAVNDENGLPEVLAAASVLVGEPVGVDVLDDAAAAGLLRVDAAYLHFRHPLTRSGILHSASVARRQAANAALATVLEQEPHRRVWHRAHSTVGPDGEIADELEANYPVYLHRGLVSLAIWSLERSAQLTCHSATRGRRLLQAAEQAFDLGRADMVDRLVTAAARESLSEAQWVRMACLREIVRDGMPGTSRLFELCDAARESSDAGDADLALTLLLTAARRVYWAETPPTARSRVVEVVRYLRRRHPNVEDDPRYLATLAVAQPVRQGRGAMETLSRRATVDNRTDAADLHLLGGAAYAVGDVARAADFLDRSEAKLRDEGRLGILARVLGLQTSVRIELGDVARATAAAEEARRLTQETGQPTWTLSAAAGDARLAGLRGDAETALDLAAKLEQQASGLQLTCVRAHVQHARGLALASAGRYTDAYDALLRLFDPADPSYHERERFGAVMLLADAAVRAGRRDDARKVIADLETVASTTPAPVLHLQLRYARAVLADDADADALYLAALDEDLARWPWPKARLELAYGSWLRRQRRIAESRTPLRAAQTTLTLLGATAWAETARAELRAAGDQTPIPTPTRNVGEGPHRKLSPQELQIARLVATGLSNREIGERLHLSPRTIGSHLYRIFPKLDVTSRSQLAARFLGFEPCLS